MVIGANIDRSHPVMGNLIRRAVSQNHAKLIVIDSNQDVLPLWSDLSCQNRKPVPTAFSSMAWPEWSSIITKQ